MGILGQINSPADVKALPQDELGDLCAELREFMIKSVSKTGGHLASSLGLVEITVALHRVFDTSKDRLVFDVGHQCYIHKILTGRKDGFHTLRQFGGLSAFPKPSESVHDAFIAGHASTSISAALGIARARTLSRCDYSVIALLGDGALTGGLAYEGLSDAGESGEPMIIILNDNGMSINGNVGGVARFLSRQRLKPSYTAFKKRYKRLLDVLPFGSSIYRFTHNVKTMLKEAILHCNMFEDMGLQYSGPVDGHDVQKAISALRWANSLSAPSVVHFVTKKGRGYEPAEENPEEYHGVSPFDHLVGAKPDGEKTFSSVFGQELEGLAAVDPRICAITASMTAGTGLTGFAARFRNRFFDVGIAEGHAVVMAAGMATRGAIPVFAVYSTFLQRSYDMLIHDVSLCRQHIVFAVDRAGLIPGDGETHQGIFDVAFLCGIPGMTVLCPASFAELRDMLRLAATNLSGPVAVRYPRGSEGSYTGGGTESFRRLREGSDFTLITYGISINTALEAAKALEGDKISVEIIKLGCISPLDIGPIAKSVKKTNRLLVLEECTGRGAVGERIAAGLAVGNICPKSLILLNIGDSPIPCGSIGELRQLCGIDTESVRSAIKSALAP